ncbi:alcohol dehydrogenase catalytic domain-containing protein [Accumulibacter sp.]|uniref:alcohol dehydrogenase catalytic domain-containing protein n=1 Tax=Accumulibacter sp. TaxID=2053492 RepID=UPI002626D790|nr:alcohol dehydrogenase catalytic domain-containing protein [Accumulibacter sp.]
MDNPYKFVGEGIPYQRVSFCLPRWGDFYVRNEKRAGRTLPLQRADCPFCDMATGVTIPPGSIRRVQFGNEDYVVVSNNNPIVQGQWMLIPAPTDIAHPAHRLDLNSNDVRLALCLAQGKAPHVEKVPTVCYVNTLPGSGRSVAHLHINCVPACNVPRLPPVVVPWQICTAGACTISRLAGAPFYAIVVQGNDDEALAELVADLHQRMNEWQQPYNLLVYSDDLTSASVRVALVPRDAEYCEAADQRIGGLEFLTGVLIPGSARIGMMDTILRDRALSQATLKADAQLHLERRLRGAYDLPPAGSVVRARSDGGNRYKGLIEQNTILSQSIGRPPPKRSGKGPVFGVIDRECWSYKSVYPQRSFHDNRVNANVLVRITRASICQSDRRVLANEKSAEVRELALGHEGGGYVVDPGPWEKELAAGEKVVVLPHLSCGNCEQCHGYMSNLCPQMEHLGFHLHGNLATLMAFPYQCVLPVGADFPDDALPLVEPLACVLRALFRLRLGLRLLPPGDRTMTIFGGGPMGYLTALAVKRNWPTVGLTIVEPSASRRSVIDNLQDGFDVVEKMPRGRRSSITFVAASAYSATVAALDATDFGGTALLFSGINTGDRVRERCGSFSADELEHYHRSEVVLQHEADANHRINLIGSSGYILDDVTRSLSELRQHYEHQYKKLQTEQIDGLSPRVEALLSSRGVDDPAVAETLKVLIRI